MKKDSMKMKNTFSLLIPIFIALVFTGNCHRNKIGKQYKAQPSVVAEGKIALVHENHIVKRFGFVDEKAFLNKFEEKFKNLQGIEMISFRESRKKIQEAKLDTELAKINFHDPIGIKTNSAFLTKLSTVLGTDKILVVYSDEDAFPLTSTLLLIGGGFYYQTTNGHGRGIFHSVSLIDLKNSNLLFQEFVSWEITPLDGPARGKTLGSILIDGLANAKDVN
ncbi:hypothetical protein [Leptospira santarosai]|uniref:hypothetical protein n=1 Tax=Leptospira santarosai TaxID=28183 RepID=UPI000772FEB5|nr:hypothetical protein [Leptospira santarosai]MDI7226590.1 hypothetical protein [Leptospira santarosai]